MDKQREVRDYLFRWIRLSQIGVTIEGLIEKRGYKKIAIYGWDKIAECLLYELKDSTIKLCGIIDRRGKDIGVDFPVFTIQTIKQLDVEVVVICPVDNYTDIKKDIKRVSNVPLLTFGELIYEL